MLVNFFLKSTPLHYERQILTDFANSVGGRVLNFVCISEDFQKSREQIIKLIDKLNWKKGFFRKDIGHKVIS